jgi:flagellar basal-body rod modification protein FlgD
MSQVGTTNIWPYYSKQNVQTAARKPVTELGKDQFLQILITQLRNQDPMQPLQDSDFIAQMAQFSALEQTMNMAAQLTQLRQSAGLVAGLIGKTVTWTETTQSGVVEHAGVVDSIVRRDGIQYVKIGTREVKIDDLLSISETVPDTGGDPDA